MNLARFGIVDSQAFHGLLSAAARTGELPVLPVLRTFVLEARLKNVATRFRIEPLPEESQPSPVKAALLRSNFFFGRRKPKRKEVTTMKYEEPQITALPDAVTSALANPLMKREQPSDGPGSQITVATYSSDE